YTAVARDIEASGYAANSNTQFKTIATPASRVQPKVAGVKMPGRSRPRARQYTNSPTAPNTQRRNTTFQALCPDSSTKTPTVPDIPMAAAIWTRPPRSLFGFIAVLPLGHR